MRISKKKIWLDYLFDGKYTPHWNILILENDVNNELSFMQINTFFVREESIHIQLTCTIPLKEYIEFFQQLQIQPGRTNLKLVEMAKWGMQGSVNSKLQINYFYNTKFNVMQGPLSHLFYYF